MGRLFDEWKQKNAETGEKSVNDKACGELVHKRALLIFNPVAGEGRSLRLLPQVVKHMTDNGYACTTLTTINSGSATEYVKKYGAENVGSLQVPGQQQSQAKRNDVNQYNRYHCERHGELEGMDKRSIRENALVVGKSHPFGVANCGKLAERKVKPFRKRNDKSNQKCQKCRQDKKRGISF